MPRRPLRIVSYTYIYFAALLLALHYAFTIYINSTFLSEFFEKRTVSLLYTAGALGTLLGLIIIPRLIRRFGAYRPFVVGLMLEVIALAGLFLSNETPRIAGFFILHQMLPPLLLFFLDVYLESAITTESITGRIRSNYMTVLSAAFLFSPFLVGRIVDASSYRFIYLISALFVSFLLIVVVDQFRRRKTHAFHEVNFSDSVIKFEHRPGLAKVFLLGLLLQCFYALMVIYTPLYLHNVTGFSWSTIGVLFTIMLVPFVLFEAPLGRVFDASHSEQDVIMAGFLVMAISTAGMFFTGSTSVIVWACLLFFSRVGASFVEIGTEYSFFKRVTDRNAGFISVYRTAMPLAFIISPLIAGIITVISSLNYIFLAASIVCVLGMSFAYTLNRLPARFKIPEWQ